MVRALLTTVLVMVGLQALLAQDIRPGANTLFPTAIADRDLFVSIPSNYDAEEAWPIIFHYHTLGMGPNTTLPGYYTSGRDFILVAMPWTEQDIFLKEQAFFDAEWEKLTTALKELTTQLSIDLSRIYLGGGGMGGWYASFLADRHLNELAGVYMTSAGNYTFSKQTGIPSRRPIPVYIGAGQMELNRGPSLHGMEYFKRLNGRVTFDEYLGVAHILPVPPMTVSNRLHQWFQIEANRKTPEEGRALVAKWQQNIETKWSGLKAGQEQFVFLDHLPDFPFYPALPADFRQQLSAWYEDVLKIPGMQAEVDAQRAYERVLHEEIQDQTISHRRRIAHDYVTVHEQYPETWYGLRAGLSVVRLKGQVEDPERWIFQTAEQEERFLAEVKRNPLPRMNDESLQRRMQYLVNIVLISQSAAQ